MELRLRLRASDVMCGCVNHRSDIWYSALIGLIRSSLTTTADKMHACPIQHVRASSIPWHGRRSHPAHTCVVVRGPEQQQRLPPSFPMMLLVWALDRR